MAEQLIETNTATAVLTEATGALIDVELITPGWGSSGYYGAEVLEAAGRDRVFAAGTHMYIDHPSVSENSDRPERSVRDLAAVLTEDATWDGSALRGKARVFAAYQPLVAEMKDAIGVSIRAGGEVEMGEAEGRRGRIVTQLVNATSVDFVTRAGRGGRIAQLLESARTDTVTERAASHGIAEATANDLREQLQAALRAAHTGLRYLYVRDFDDARVWFEGSTGSDDSTALLNDATYQQSYVMSGDAVTLTGSLVQVRQVISYVPVNVTEARHTDTTKEGLVPELSEAEVTALRDSAAQAQAERDAALAEAATIRTQLAEAQARQDARPVIAGKVAESKTLGARTQARLVESLLAGLPMTDGKVDEPKLTAAIESAVKQAEDEIADYAPAAGTRVFGSFGSVNESAATGDQLTESSVDANIGAAFGRTVKGN